MAQAAGCSQTVTLTLHETQTDYFQKMEELAAKVLQKAEKIETAADTATQEVDLKSKEHEAILAAKEKQIEDSIKSHQQVIDRLRGTFENTKVISEATIASFKGTEERKLQALQEKLNDLINEKKQ
jgi:hypothetical protein